MVENGNGGCPGGTLVPSVDVRHYQFCTKRHMYHARIGPRFHLFHTGFCNDTAFLKVRAHPVLAPLCAEGCRDDLPSGGNAFRTLTSRLSSFAMAAATEHYYAS